MPSNAYVISQHIAHCQQLLADHGDVDCVLVDMASNAIVAIDGRNVNVDIAAIGQKLPAPALIIGLWRDAAGGLRNMPGALYQVSGDANGGWSPALDAAPEGVDVSVWKRYGGEDVGRRIDGKWYVREGAAEWPPRPVQIVPGGILQWRPLP